MVSLRWAESEAYALLSTFYKFNMGETIMGEYLLTPIIAILMITSIIYLAEK
tara:strand:+ start:1381 stop:1536 length:156 start_codon:yes stop_codon:yes gene_type:complete